jgi:glycerol-3-phosphate responsive antiterminator
MNRSEFMKALGVAAIAASGGVSIADAAASQDVEVAPGITEETAEAIRKRLEELFYPGGLITAEAFREAFMMVLLGRTLR